MSYDNHKSIQELGSSLESDAESLRNVALDLLADRDELQAQVAALTAELERSRQCWNCKDREASLKERALVQREGGT